MKIYRPLWTDGAVLAPQQFQQQASLGCTCSRKRRGNVAGQYLGSPACRI